MQSASVVKEVLLRSKASVVAAEHLVVGRQPTAAVFCGLADYQPHVGEHVSGAGLVCSHYNCYVTDADVQVCSDLSTWSQLPWLGLSVMGEPSNVC